MIYCFKNLKTFEGIKEDWKKRNLDRQRERFLGFIVLRTERALRVSKRTEKYF